jgi:hypothetical protein
MNRIVKEHYPVANLPEDLRQGLDPSEEVRVIVEVAGRDEAQVPRSGWFEPPERIMSLEEIFALREPPFRSVEDIVADLRRERDAWDD